MANWIVTSKIGAPISTGFGLRRFLINPSSPTLVTNLTSEEAKALFGDKNDFAYAMVADKEEGKQIPEQLPADVVVSGEQTLGVPVEEKKKLPPKKKKKPSVKKATTKKKKSTWAIGRIVPPTEKE